MSSTANMSNPKTSSRLADRALIALEALVGLAVVAAIVGKAYGAAPTIVFVMCGASLAFTAYALMRLATALTDRSLDFSGRIDDEERETLEHEKLLLLQGIKELEADHAIGKVAPEDYQHLRQTAEARAVDIIARIKLTDQRWLGEAERLIEKRLGHRALGLTSSAAPTTEDSETWLTEDRDARAARMALSSLFDHRPVAMAAKADDLICGACQTTNDTDAKFCVGCGRPNEAAA